MVISRADLGLLRGLIGGAWDVGGGVFGLGGVVPLLGLGEDISLKVT